MSGIGVAFIVNSTDAKLVMSKRNPGASLRCAATYRPIAQTCRAEECDLHPKTAGPGRKCYVVRSNVGMHNRRLEGIAEASGATALALSLEEARLIKTFAVMQPRKFYMDLRLGVSGEVSGPKGARALADAAAHWLAHVGGMVWGYTHAWRRILRRSFGSASVLASVDRPEDIMSAMKRGYVPAIVVERHEGTAPIVVNGHRFIRCPNETMGMACVECRLCLDDGRLRERGFGIAFARKKNKVHLKVIGGELWLDTLTS